MALSTNSQFLDLVNFIIITIIIAIIITDTITIDIIIITITDIITTNFSIITIITIIIIKLWIKITQNLFFPENSRNGVNR